MLHVSLHARGIFAAAALLAPALIAPRLASAAAAAPAVSFYDDIKPLFAIHCYKCHGPETSKGGLRLDLREAALGKTKSGSPALVPGDSRASGLFVRISSHDPDELMPKQGQRLTDPEIDRVRLWIDQGASWPEKDDYWAFKPARHPQVPTGSTATRPNPIDAFIETRFQEAKIEPAPRADARTLLRRAYADLLGVPPSPEEAVAFLADRSPEAFEKLIDRLLADPRYGERWARHWLDLVRYSESDGFEDDKIRPHAWRYRDYVVRSFNADKPYDRFVQEQIAGDELWPGDPDAWVATGFARLGMWDGMSKDPPRQRQDFLNDVTDAVGSVFLGLTVGCARCHDHKYDRITQRDYYSLQAFFANATRGTHELTGDAHDPPHVIEAWRKSNAELTRLRGERDAIFREARVQLEWEHRCEVDEHAQVRITDAQIVRRAEELYPTRAAALTAQIKEWEQVERLNRPTAEVIFEAAAPSPKTFLLKGRELSRPGAETPPRFIEAITPQEPPPPVAAASGKSIGRRTLLARWLTSPDNPLVARVIVNRVWQHHFGRGIVATPSDFGRHGQHPTHPELLDCLACRLVEDGWSLKRMHRLIMTSAAYQRAAAAVDSAAAVVDPENNLLWRMNRRRLEAEAIRDSMLTVSGQLSSVRGGPGVYPQIPKDVNVQLPNNDKELSWGVCTAEEGRRRSIYIFQRRSLTFPLVEVFDGAAMSQSCPVRPQTTVAPQALALFNGEFCREQARQLARSVRRAAAGNDSEQQIRHVFVVALARQPAADEVAAAKTFLAKQASVRRAAPAPGADDADLAAFDDFCHVILNTNEFIFFD